MRSHRWWIQNCSVWRSVSKNMAHDDLPMLYRHRVAALHWKESAPALPLHHEVYSTHAIDPATHIATPRDRGACTHNTWARMPDILDWIEANRNALQQVGALRWQETHGFLYYGTVFWTWLTRRQNRDPSSSSQAVPDEKIGSVSASASNVSASEQTTSGATSKSCNEAPLHGAARLQVVATQERLEKKSNETATTPSEAGSSNMMEQYQQSRELCNILKWKRVTWDADADYEGFARRILEVHAHGYFSTIPAMSHLCVHVVADRELKRPTRWEPVSPSQDYRSIQSGSLTAWALHEGVPFLITEDPGKESEPREPRGDDVETPQHSSPFRVDWSRGEICLLDTASPSDVYTFLTHYAQPLQRVQLEYAEEQERMAELVESVRFRCSLVALHFNDTTQQALRDDGPEFVARCRGAPGGYVTTDQVLEFCSSMLRTAWLFRRFLRGHVVRILPPRHPYEIDLERRVIGIPCDFGRYHYRREHRRYLRHESIANTYRNYWFVWLLVVCAMIGDLDIF